MVFQDFLFKSEENPDWGCARNLRSVLMNPSAEWVHGISSCQFDLNGKTFVVPNRDYPYEGLLVYQDTEHWKFIDCLAVGLESAGRYCGLSEERPPTVRVNPWAVRYLYHFQTNSNDARAQASLSVTYRLDSITAPGAATGCIEFKLNGARDPVRLVIQPFVDLRWMYASSDFSQYDVDFGPLPHNVVRISSFNRILTFFLPPGEVVRFDGHPEFLNWWYKLGTGSRTESSQGDHPATVFISESRPVASYFMVMVPVPNECHSAKLHFSCRLRGSPDVGLAAIKRFEKDSAQRDREQSNEVGLLLHSALSPDLRNALIARIVGLVKFKSLIHRATLERLVKGAEFERLVHRTLSDEWVAIPHAGAWWFRTPWFRDVFEGIVNSFRTLSKLPGEKDNVRKTICLALSLQQSETGLIPNRIPESTRSDLPYDGVDGTLLCFVAASRYASETRDEVFTRTVLEGANRFLSYLLATAVDPGAPDADGPPRLHRDSGLLLCAPRHSWLDTRTQTVHHRGQSIKALPNRISAQFARDLMDRVSDKTGAGDLLSTASFLLPEINAQWITMLRGLLHMLDTVVLDSVDTRDLGWSPEGLRIRVENTLTTAEENFQEVFWNEETGFLYNAVCPDLSVKDAVECEAAVVAAALLGERIFTREQLLAIWEHVQKTLLVHRTPIRLASGNLPFGILAKNDDKGAFYHDDQYHSDVVWLRSSPYLIRLLSMLQQNDVIEQILLNTLDHQVTEGAVFYNHELFSKPLGNNPSSTVATCNNPVPVKNPIQFWSQWCDPFLDFYGRKESRG